MPDRIEEGDIYLLEGKGKEGDEEEVKIKSPFLAELTEISKLQP